MGVRNYLIEGGSGVGKTSVAEELQRRGHHVIHGDRGFAYYGDPETGAPVNARPYPTEAENVQWGYEHWIWPVDQVRSLVADQNREMTFFCGHSANFQHFIGLFDKVFVLTLDPETLNQRLLRRPEDEFGGKPLERAWVMRLHATHAGLPANAVSIQSGAPIAAVADAVLSHCTGLNNQRPPRL